MASKVEFTSHAEEVKNGMLEMEKKALRKSGKILKEASKNKVPVKSGDLQKVIATWVRVNKRTGDVKLQLGVYNAKKAKQKGLAPAGTRAHLTEFGSAHNRAVSFLKGPTVENVDAIRNAQAEFLPGIQHMSQFEDVDEEVE